MCPAGRGGGKRRLWRLEPGESFPRMKQPLTEAWDGNRFLCMAKTVDKDGWPWFGVYLYRADGTYSRAVWAKTQGEFSKMLPKIARHVKKGLEVAITSTGDEMLFHARKGGIEWDGIGLEPVLERHSK